MLQRIQSLYLLSAFVMAVLVAIFPLAYLTTSDGALYDLYSRGLLMTYDGTVVQPMYYLFALVLLAAVVPFITIFLWGRRMLQIRLCGISSVLFFGIYVLGGVYFYLSDRVFDLVSGGVVGWGVHAALFCPAVGVVMSVLAGKNILRDELLLRSVNRLR